MNHDRKKCGCKIYDLNPTQENTIYYHSGLADHLILKDGIYIWESRYPTQFRAHRIKDHLEKL